jgi:hypothetical protein
MALLNFHNFIFVINDVILRNFVGSSQLQLSTDLGFSLQKYKI